MPAETDEYFMRLSYYSHQSVAEAVNRRAGVGLRGVRVLRIRLTTVAPLEGGSAGVCYLQRAGRTGDGSFIPPTTENITD